MSKSKKRLPVLLKVILWSMLMGTLCFAGAFGAVCLAEQSEKKDVDLTRGEVIVVLGSQVYPDGSLSPNLTYRVTVALDAYNQRPRMICVCGGQGKNEPAAEADRMRDWLVQHGVPAEMILVDNTSTDTLENLQNARRLLPDTDEILLVTSDFHVPRAIRVAEKQGFTAYGGPAPIRPEYWLKHHFRETLAWVKWIIYDLFGWDIDITWKM